MSSPGFLSLLKDRFLRVNRERWLRRIVQRSTSPSANGFFDHFTRFLSTSDTAAQPNRLNQRHRALIEANLAVIQGKRVLDIASHDGRWSFAAHRAGADYVLGVEARAHLTALAADNMRFYEVPQDCVEFRQGDALTTLDGLPEGSFDTVFCFGFLYHTIDHMPLLRKVARLKPAHFLLDTAISTDLGSIVEIHDEAIEHESAGAVGEPGEPARTIIGLPSKAALELMLHSAGFPGIHYYEWKRAGIRQWADLGDYYLGKRITLASSAKASVEKGELGGAKPASSRSHS